MCFLHFRGGVLLRPVFLFFFVRRNARTVGTVLVPFRYENYYGNALARRMFYIICYTRLSHFATLPALEANGETTGPALAGASSTFVSFSVFRKSAARIRTAADVEG